MKTNVQIERTGIGILSPLGIGFEEFLPALFEAEPPEPDPETLAYRLPEYDPRDFIPTRKTYLDPNSAAAMTATALALEQSPPGMDLPPGERIGMLMSTTMGNHATMTRFFKDVQTKGPRLVKPMLFQHAYMNSSLSLVCMEWGWKGPHLLAAGEAPAALQCLLDGADRLDEHAAEVVFVAAADTLKDAPGKRHAAGNVSQKEQRRLSEGAIVLRLNRIDAVPATGNSPNGLTIRGGACGFAPAGEQRLDGIARIVKQALADAGRGMEDLGGILIAASADEELECAIAQALRPLAAPSTGLIVPDMLCGHAGSVDGLLLAATAAAILKEKSWPAFPLPDTFHRQGFPAPESPEFCSEKRDFLLLGADPAGAVTAVILGG